jgi:hypothetical protein
VRFATVRGGGGGLLGLFAFEKGSDLLHFVLLFFLLHGVSRDKMNDL